MKLLILLAVGYFCYQAMKKWMTTGSSSPDKVSSTSAGEIDDVMIQDPVCGVYFPKGDSIDLQYQGEELFFCSQECKAKFIHSHKET
jgi:YHS domain-containing protein